MKYQVNPSLIDNKDWPNLVNMKNICFLPFTFLITLQGINTMPQSIEEFANRVGMKTEEIQEIFSTLTEDGFLIKLEG